MRVEFAPCGVGFGHAGRCIPIAMELTKRTKNAEVLFSTYRDATNYIRREGFNTVEVPPMDFKVKPDGTVDFRRTAMNPGPFVASFSLLSQIVREIEIMETFKPDIVVSDSRASPLIAARILGIPTLCILNQFQVIIPRKTRYLRLAKFADAFTLAILGRVWISGVKVMIPDLPAPYTISTGNLRIPKSYRGKVELIGPILPVRSEALPSKEALRRKLGLEEKKPVIFAPISGPSNERAYLTSIIQKIFAEFPDGFQIAMSLGHPQSHHHLVKHRNLQIFGWISNRFEYLKAADLIISRAGHGTIMQAICYGKPVILIPTPGHTEQHNNAARTVELGVGLAVEQEDLNTENLVSMAMKVMDGGFRKKISRIQKKTLHLDGLETAVKTAIEIVEG